MHIENIAVNFKNMGSERDLGIGVEVGGASNELAVVVINVLGHKHAG
jgi:hypothetical protein